MNSLKKFGFRILIMAGITLALMYNFETPQEINASSITYYWNMYYIETDYQPRSAGPFARESDGRDWIQANGRGNHVTTSDQGRTWYVTWNEPVKVHRYRTVVSSTNSQAYPYSGESGGYYYQYTHKSNSAPTTPSLTVPTVQFEHGDQHILSWNATDEDGDTLTYTLELSYNNGSSWTSLYSGTNKNYTYTVPTNQTQVNFRVRAYDGKAYSDYGTSANKTIREAMYYWSKYNANTNNTYNFSSVVENERYEVEVGFKTYPNYSFNSASGRFSMTGTEIQPYYVGEFGYRQSGLNGMKKYTVVDRSFIDVEGNWYTSIIFKVEAYTSTSINSTYSRGTLIQSNIQAGYNAYLHNQRNPDGFWWIRGQRISAPDTTPPIIELTEQTTYASTSIVTVKTYDISTISATKWAVGDQPASYFTTSGTNVTSGQFTATQNGIYTVYALDAAGNAAVQTIEVSKIDTTKPTAILTQTPNEFTNGNVTLTASGADTGSGMKRIKLPNGTFVTDSNATYSVAANGVYTFEFEDHAGNSLSTSITVSNIDKIAPTIQFTPESREADFKDIDVQTNIADVGGSGFKQARYVWTKDETRPAEGWSEWNTVLNPLITQDKGGKWFLHMEAQDHAGNIRYASSGMYEKIVVSGGPNVNINVFPTPTGVWHNKPIDAYVMDSGDSELLAKAKKYYEVSSSPLYPNSFGKTIPSDKKIQLNLQGENFVHVQYALDDGTKISATAGPYLIDTSNLADFEMKLVSANDAPAWNNQAVRFIITDPSSSSVSGYEKQYRIDGYHTDWQTYYEGVTVLFEGANRIFGRIVNKAGMSSEQKTLVVNIDESNPELESLLVTKQPNGTYDVVVKAKDDLSGIKEVRLNGNLLTLHNNRFEIKNVPLNQTNLVIEDNAINQHTITNFLPEPVITFEAPYSVETEMYRTNVVASIANATGYIVGNRAYSCTENPCKVTLTHNTTLTAVRTEGIKETRVVVNITNIDKSNLQLLLAGKRNTSMPKNITFTWNYSLTDGKLSCIEDAQPTIYNVSGKSFVLSGQNYVYDCTLSGDYQSIPLTSNRIVIYPDPSLPTDGTGDLSGQTKTTNVHLLETRLGKGYLINGKSDNYKHDSLPIPVNDITAN